MHKKRLLTFLVYLYISCLCLLTVPNFLLPNPLLIAKNEVYNFFVRVLYINPVPHVMTDLGKNNRPYSVCMKFYGKYNNNQKILIYQTQQHCNKKFIFLTNRYDLTLARTFIFSRNVNPSIEKFNEYAKSKFNGMIRHMCKLGQLKNKQNYIESLILDISIFKFKFKDLSEKSESHIEKEYLCDS